MRFRRYLSLTAMVIMATIILHEEVGGKASIAFASIVTIVFVFGTVRKGKGIPVIPSEQPFIVCLTLILMWTVVIHLAYIDGTERVLTGLEGRTVQLQGPAREIEYRKKDDGYRMSVVMEVVFIDGKKIAPESILVDAPHVEGISPGDTLKAEGMIRLPEPKRNPNTFDYAGHLRTKGIYTTMYVEELKRVGGPSGSILSRLFRLRVDFVERVAMIAGEPTASLIQAILFGDKDSLDEDVRETFQKNGTAHILAVSGLHVGMLYAFILWLYRALGTVLPSLKKRGWGFFVSIGSLMIIYAFMAGCSPSVVRAVTMIMLHIFASMTGRYYDLKSATFAVFTAALVFDPLKLLQSGFQMSFLAILSIAIVLPYLRRFLSGALLAGASVQLGLMPYIMYQFNWFTWLSVLINIPVILLAGLIVPLGMVSFLFSVPASVGVCSSPGTASLAGSVFEAAVSLTDRACVLLDRGLGILCDLMVRLNELCCVEGITAVRVTSPPAWLLFMFYLALVAFASETGRLLIRRSGKKAVLGLTVTITTISMCIGAAVDDGYRKMDLVFVDVGQGDCMHLRVNDGPRLSGKALLPFKTKNYLIDGGGDDDYEVGRKILRPYLLKNGVRTIDGAFVTHLHTDHYRGICELAREGMVRHIYLYEANRLKTDEICRDTGLDRDRIHFLAKGDRVFLSGHTDHIDVIWPERKSDREYERMLADEEDENASSLIMRLILEGVSMLATGDLGEEGEREIIGAHAQPSSATGGPAENQPVGRSSMGLESDILKVGHHGSKYSSCDEFLDAVSPRVAVIQVSKGNTYGHPTPEVLARLESRNIPVYRNDTQGAIGFSLNEGRIKVDCMSEHNFTT